MEWLDYTERFNHIFYDFNTIFFEMFKANSIQENYN